MTTDEVQETGEPGGTTKTDEFSSENYVAPIDSFTRSATPTPTDDDAQTVILGSVPDDRLAEPETTSPDPASTGETEHVDAVGGNDDPDTATITEPGEAIDETPEIGTDGEPEAAETPSEQTISEQTLSEQAVIDGAVDDGDTDHGRDTEHGRDDSGATESRPADDSYLEMRQVAGLTAGSMMKLTVGRAFEFNESNEGGSFSLRVLENGEVVVHPGSARAVIDEIEVDEPMIMGDALLNVSSACFSVRRPRPPASSESRMEAIGAAFASISAISVPAIGSDEPLSPDQLMGSRLGTIINRNPLTRGAVGSSAWNFLQSIRRTRSVVAERHRLMHPDPEELKTRLSRLDPGLWERSGDHPLFGRFSVGYASIPWEPKFDNPELIPEMLHESIVDMSLLPWVPVTANLLYGPLGIVGKRAARLAACRHAILSLATLSMPGDIQFAIRSGKNTATSWNWARALPPILSAGDDSPYVVTIIDGADGARVNEAARREANDRPPAGTGDAGDVSAEDVDTTEAAVAVDAEAVVVDPHPTTEVPVIDPADVGGADELGVLGSVRAQTPGYIVLAETVDELSRPCGTVLQIESDGTGSVTNHLNETIQVTPIGVTEAFAHDMATRIADILTDSFL